jgi:hypothetical protein
MGPISIVGAAAVSFVAVTPGAVLSAGPDRFVPAGRTIPVVAVAAGAVARPLIPPVLRPAEGTVARVELLFVHDPVGGGFLRQTHFHSAQSEETEKARFLLSQDFHLHLFPGEPQLLQALPHRLLGGGGGKCPLMGSHRAASGAAGDLLSR